MSVLRECEVERAVIKTYKKNGHIFKCTDYEFCELYSIQLFLSKHGL
jgi:hypothetical protein